jgi:translation initiation factor 4E
MEDIKKTKLPRKYTLWYTSATEKANYEEKLKQIAVFETVEDFWAVYQHLKRPDQIPNDSDYNLFVDEIKPMWEDENNKRGGKWIMRLKKGYSSKFWEDLVLAFIGHKLDDEEDVVGLIVSCKDTYDTISIWNRKSDNVESIERTKDRIKTVLCLPKKTEIEYKQHPQYIQKK